MFSLTKLSSFSRNYPRISRQIHIKRIDHLVLTVKNINRTIEFYEQVLSMRTETFRGGRTALVFGDQKFNLHEVGKEFEPKASVAAPGTVDIRLITDDRMTSVVNHLRKCDVETVYDDVVDRTGATGPIKSVYFRDPDLNLIEVSTYDVSSSV